MAVRMSVRVRNRGGRGHREGVHIVIAVVHLGFVVMPVPLAQLTLCSVEQVRDDMTVERLPPQQVPHVIVLFVKAELVGIYEAAM